MTARGTAVDTARRDILGGLEVHRIPHQASSWLISRSDDRDRWLAEKTGAWRPYPRGLTELSLPTRRGARAVRALLLTHVPDWRAGDGALVRNADGQLHYPDLAAWARALIVLRMVNAVNARRVRGLCLGCGLRRGSCHTWEPRFGPRYSAEELAWTQ